MKDVGCGMQDKNLISLTGLKSCILHPASCIFILHLRQWHLQLPPQEPQLPPQFPPQLHPWPLMPWWLPPAVLLRP